uniref:Uncharacterized protein n=1 Tax=Amphimedon queenslandica TaxID=400682 RepID=A0A1X7U9B0_AMPQE
MRGSHTHTAYWLNSFRVKLGGDKGGSSLKMNFQIMNGDNPSSIHNTSVFLAFEAIDSVLNLHVALARYKDQGHDYENQCHMYGISRATSYTRDVTFCPCCLSHCMQ